MKKILITGLPADITEAQVRAALARFGPVHAVDIIREGNPDQPVIVVHMDVSDEVVFQISTRVTDIWHGGYFVNARLLLH